MLPAIEAFGNFTSIAYNDQDCTRSVAQALTANEGGNGLTDTS